MGQPVRLMGKDDNEAIQAQVSKAGELETRVGGYNISDLDESSDPAYYGFSDAIGSFYIMEFNTASGAVRYYAGSSGYTTAWSNRASLSYGYYYNIF